MADIEPIIEKSERPKRTPKPKWIKVKAPTGDAYLKMKAMMKELKLATVCEEAGCPNIAECWSGKTATIMLMGDTCTRGCRFCLVKSGKQGQPLDPKEPEKVGYTVGQLGLEYIVLTSVDRDDLEDLGSSHFASTVNHLRLNDPKLIIEVLVPDFQGKEDLIDKLIESKPHVIAQNIETVERLTRRVRDRRAGYEQTMDFLKYVKQKDPTRYTKTSIMLGLGETNEEILQTLKDLRDVDCDVVTFGQYLQPSKKQLKVDRFYTPEEFDYWREQAMKMGFLYCASGPLVRSSYKAAEFFMKGVVERQRQGELTARADV